MKRADLSFIWLTFLLLLPVIVSQADAVIPEAVSVQKNTVVRLHINDRSGKRIYSGKGFIIDERGVIATHCQIIAKWFEQGGNVFEIELKEGVHIPIEELISSRCENNLVLIRIQATDLPAVKLSVDPILKAGEQIVIIDGNAREGFIKSIPEKGGKTFQISPLVTPDRSGSPLFNAKGEAIGAAVFLPKKGANQHTAVLLSDLARQLEQYRKRKSAFVSVRQSRLGIDAEQTSDKNAKDYFLLGCSHEKAGLYREAIEAYIQSLRMSQNNVEAYINLGVVYHKLGKHKEAIDSFTRALVLQPDSPSICNKLGTSFMITGAYTDAINAFREAVKIDPGNAAAHLSLGIAYYLAGDTMGAYQEYMKLKNLDKNRATVLHNIIN